MIASDLKTDRQRIDIQALRGLAILLVLLHHARLLPGLKAGFLGVDIFFVVSGYLITGLIQRALAAGTFSFSTFYMRRAKRLLPAAYVVFAATALLSPVFLTSLEMKDFAWQLLGAVTFTGNMVLWAQTGYFEGSAALKPLLHVWSLAIEEQYYLLLPAALVFTPRRFWAAGTCAIMALSLALCFTAWLKPEDAFFWFPTRAWEMALGSLGVLVLEGSVISAWLVRLFWPAVAALLLVPFFPTGLPHPGVDALIVCIATLVVLLRNHPLLNTGWPMRGMALLGDISYSLYLVHWPLLAFAASAWVAPVPGFVRLGLMALALVLAIALHKWVEQPVRHAPIQLDRRSVSAALAVSALIGFSGLLIHQVESARGQVDYTNVRRGNVGLSSTCNYDSEFSPRSECMTKEKPEILVWGDSYAMHLVEGIRTSGPWGLAQATKSTCGPLLDVAPYLKAGFYDLAWSQKCLAFNDSVLAYLAATPSVQVVVMSSLYAQYLPGSRLLVRDHAGTAGTRKPNSEQNGSQDLAAASLVRTILAVRAMGKRVVLVAPPPAASGVDFGRCLELKASGKVFMGADTDSCAMSEPRYRSGSAPVRSLLDHVRREANVEIFNLDTYLCGPVTCTVEMDGTFLYRDIGHLSFDGSRLLGNKLNMASQLVKMAH